MLFIHSTKNKYIKLEENECVISQTETESRFKILGFEVLIHLSY